MRKFLALIMAVAMIATLASVVFAADTKTVSVTYTFDENKADAGLTEHGTVTYADGKATFGADGWLESDIDLKGATSLKVTAVVKAPRTRVRRLGFSTAHLRNRILGRTRLTLLCSSIRTRAVI